MRFRLSKTVLAGLAALAVAWAVSPRAASADTFTYNTVRRQIRTGIIVSKALEVFDNGKSLGPENPDPHVFYVLDSRTDLKPLGMEFVNPLAPAVVTSDIYQRWLNRPRNGFPDPAFVNNTPQSRQFRVGNRVTKNMGCYWEVNVDNLSSDDLKQFDLLFLTCHVRDVAFSRDVVARLHKFVEGGGTLWVENCGRFSFSRNAPFLFDFQFTTVYNGNPGGAVLATPNHPLLTYPFVIRPESLPTLGDKNVQGFFIYNPYDPTDPTYYGGDAANNGTGKNQYNPPAYQTLVPVVWNTLGKGPLVVNGVQKPNPDWRPYIMAGQIGAGKLVVSAQDSGCAVNDYVGGANIGYGGNSGAISGETFLAAKPVDCQFVYNIAAWSGAHTTANANSHHNNFSEERIGGVLVDKWTPRAAAGTAKVGGPILFKNCVFAVDGDLVLHCYDSKPSEDLDGDGNADDGIPDLIAGAPYDEIWRLPLAPLGTNPKGASTPTAIEFFDPEYINVNGETSNSVNGIPLANQKQRELIVVTLSDGTLIAVRAFPRQAIAGQPLAADTRVEWTSKLFAEYPQNLIDPAPRANFGSSLAQDMSIPSPTWSEGVLFCAMNVSQLGQISGRIVAIDPRNGLSAMHPGITGYTGDTPDKAVVFDPPLGQPGIPPVISSPTVALIRDAGTGAVDKVVYVNVAPPVNGASAAAPATVRGFWFGTRGEPLAKVNQTTWASRATTPWYVYDPPSQPLHTNPILRQRVYHTFRDPDGTYSSREFLYTVNPAPGAGFYSLTFTGNQVRVVLPNQVATPKGITATDDERNTYYADYNLDWAPAAGQPHVNARSIMNAPDPTGGGSQVAGAPAVSPDDLLYFTVTTATGNNNSGRGVLFGVREQFGGTRLLWAYTMHNGFNMTVAGNNVVVPPRLRQMDRNLPDYGLFLRNVQFFGTPAYRDGTIYVFARGETDSGAPHPVTALCAFSANPEFKIRLNQKIDSGTPIRIRQLNVVSSQSLATPTYVDLNPTQYTIDYDSGLIRITSMAVPGGFNNFFSASLPVIVQVGNGPEQLIAGRQVDSLPAGPESRIVGPQGMDNLLWYTLIPGDGVSLNDSTFPQLGYAASSPSIQGDQLWMGFQSGYIASFNLNLDPGFQATGNQVPILRRPIFAGGNLWTRNIGAGQPGALAAVSQAPIATQNVLAAGTYNGVLALEDTFTLVADNKRLVEVNAGGDAVWTSDSTRSFQYAGGDAPNYFYDEGTGNVIIANPKNGTGVPVVQNTPFARPTVARRIGTNNILVVDTGNNRVVMIDRGGNVIWEVNRLFDDFRRKLRPGDPLTLNEPTDIQYWQEFLSNINLSINQDGTTYKYQGPGYIVHYLIADTGNFRVIELVDVYDVNWNPVRPSANNRPAPFVMLRQVNFVSASFADLGKKYRYRSVQRLVLRDTDLPMQWRNGTPIRQLTLSAISNARLVGAADPNNPFAAVNAGGDATESGGGSLVLLDESGNPLTIVSNLRIPDPSVPNGFRIQPIVNPTWFSKFDEVSFNMLGQPTPTYKYLLCDDNGVYQMRAGANPADMDVEWTLSAQDYYLMTGKRLKAAGIKRLTTAESRNTPRPSGLLHRFLIANRFSGEDNPALFGITYTNVPGNGNILGSSAFHGEVFELDPTAFDWAQPGHGYSRDYVRNNNFLLPNPNASIVWRSPTETVPPVTGPPGYIMRRIGDPQRASSTSLLEQPAFADRPF